MTARELHEPSEGRHKSRLPIVGLSMISCLIAVWCIFTANLNGLNAQSLPLMLSAALLAFISFFDLRVGLAALLLAIGLSPEFQFYGIDNFRYEDFIFPIIFLIWLSGVVLDRKKLRTTDIKTPILVIIFISLISSLSNHIYSELQLKAAALRFGKSVEYYFMMVVVLNAMKDRRDLRTFAALMVLSSAFVGLYGIVQFMIDGGSAAYRLPGPPGETANILGGYFVFHMCLALGMLSKCRSKGRVILIAYLALMGLPFIMTLSRTSYVALLTGLLLIWMLARNHTLGWALVLLAFGALLSPDFVVNRFMTLFDVVSGNSESSWDARVAGWDWLIPAALQSPIIGQGVGSRDLGAIDSEYVLQLNDLGVIGLLAFLVLMFRCIRTSWRMIDMPGEDDAIMAGFTLGYFGGAIALMVHSVAATTFTTIRTTEPFFFATGLLYAYWNMTLGKRSHLHGHHGRHSRHHDPNGMTEELEAAHTPLIGRAAPPARPRPTPKRVPPPPATRPPTPPMPPRGPAAGRRRWPGDPE